MSLTVEEQARVQTAIGILQGLKQKDADLESKRATLIIQTSAFADISLESETARRLLTDESLDTNQLNVLFAALIERQNLAATSGITANAEYGVSMVNRYLPLGMLGIAAYQNPAQTALMIAEPVLHRLHDRYPTSSTAGLIGTYSAMMNYYPSQTISHFTSRLFTRTLGAIGIQQSPLQLMFSTMMMNSLLGEYSPLNLLSKKVEAVHDDIEENYGPAAIYTGIAAGVLTYYAVSMSIAKMKKPTAEIMIEQDSTSLLQRK